MRQIPTLPFSEYQKLVESSRTLKARGEKLYVLLYENQLIIKHLYKRGLWSSSTLWPYPLRFKKNSEKLKALGFAVPQIQNIYFLPEKNCHLILYPLISGTSIYDHAQQNNFEPLAKLPQFLAMLHQQGIYFRDLHTGNFITLPDKNFALIDVASVKIQRKPLTIKQRARNFAHFFNIQEDLPLLNKFGMANFLNAYFQAAKLSEKEIDKLIFYLRRRLRCHPERVLHSTSREI